MTRAVVRMLGVALGVLTLAGCAGGGPPPAPPTPAPTSAAARSPLPPRPVELPMAGIAPCSLLTDTQVRALGTNPGRFFADSGSGSLGGDACNWTNFPRKPDLDWAGGPTFKNGAELFYGREPLRTIDGFTATTSHSLATDPAYNCILLVDVAPGQALQVTFDNARKDFPGMNHTLACDKAQQVATYMLANLRAQLGR
ncbi:MAG: DUF3558 domain-containing protein [Pseudonocardia sp.]